MLCIAWEDASVKLYEEGSRTFYAIYVPEDTKNYKTVSGIPVEITVSCPKHEYKEEVILAPNATQKGQAIYTCKICGDTYTDESDVLKPDSEQPGSEVQPGSE